MLTQVLALLLCLKLGVAVVEVETRTEQKEFKVYDGFPVAIVCGEANPDEYGAYGTGDFSEYPDGSTEYPGGDGEYQGDPGYLDGLTDYPGDDGEYQGSVYPNDDENVLCTITIDGEVTFNESIIWRNRLTNGSFQNANENWDGVDISISLTWGQGNSNTKHMKTTLMSSEDKECSDQADEDSQTAGTVGDNVELVCSGQDFFYWSEEQYNSLSVSWWKGCNKIERSNSDYHYILKSYKPDPIGVEFHSLQIRNSSLSLHPGSYHCIIERNSRNRTVRHFEKSVNLCLRRPFSHEPDIRPSSEEYVVAPGKDLAITAFGTTGTKPESLSLSVSLEKQDPDTNEWKWICGAVNWTRSNENCSLSVHKNKIYCDVLTEDEIQDVLRQKLEDNFTATFYLRGATERDEGRYRINLHTTKSIDPVEFSVKVQYPPATPEWLVITPTLVGVLIASALVVLLFIHMYSVEIRYFKKKILDREIHVTKPMAYLLYYRDATENGDPVEAVRRFIGDRRFYDENNVNTAPEHNSAGHLLGDHRIDTLRQSLTLVIFVTYNMLEVNDIEIFTAYQGFEESIQNELPIVFIATKEIMNIIFQDQANARYPTVTAFRNFMKRGKNKVITWDQRHPKRFRRALYAFLPKVANSGVQQPANIA